MSKLHFIFLAVFLSVAIKIFPGTFEPDSTKKYLIYLHGRIVEDLGEKAENEKYGAYEYRNILSSLENAGFVVISEVRHKNADVKEYARKTADIVDSLLFCGIKPEQITILGASKGAMITLYAANILKNKNLNIILLAIFSKIIVEILKEENIHLYGRVLYIYDYKDEIASSGKELIHQLNTEDMLDFKEVETQLGFGHGLLYKPYDEWVNEVKKWTGIVD